MAANSHTHLFITLAYHCSICLFGAITINKTKTMKNVCFLITINTMHEDDKNYLKKMLDGTELFNNERLLEEIY